MNIYIRSKKTEGKAELHTLIRCGSKPTHFNLHMQVDIKKWIECSKTERKKANFLDSMNYTHKIQEIEKGLKILKKYHKCTKEEVEKLIENIVLQEAREEMIKREEAKSKLESERRKAFKVYVQNYLKEMQCGQRRTVKNKLYKKSTIYHWKQVVDKVLDFHKKHPFSWDEIDQRLIVKFIDYLEKDDLSKSNIQKLMKDFRKLIKDAGIEDIHNNFRARDLNFTIEVGESEKCTQVYLTKQELDGLYEMELSGTEELVRDIFLIGCFIGQRISDYGRIEPEWLGTTHNGVKVIRLEQTKTGNKVCVPIGDKLETLLKKYDYCVPKISDQEIDRTIKDICERLSLSIPSLAVKEKTMLKKQEKIALYTNKDGGRRMFEINEKGECIKPKWAMVASQTARRTCVTNMYLAKKPDGSSKYTLAERMSVSGHKTESQYIKYIKCSLDEVAEMVAAAANDDGDNNLF
ncbi:MAG: phage integrase SAM-like domain-containing protein [Muribaculaceae bacterium]|nr:phage integrase SAM-like domain-containing protein [Muribaculaceae bacterium]